MENKRYIYLDLLRCLAVLLVLVSHGSFLHIDEPHTWWWEIYCSIQKMGWAGVDLFFVMSGFLIFNIILADIKRYDQVNVRRFLIRRGLKIYPQYYLFLGMSYFFY
jgi:peptidoglycan/LPS O-acetylase OafA/YrhL